MKIGINTLITPPLKIGVGGYIDNLLSYFRENRKGNEYTILTSRKEPFDFDDSDTNFKRLFFNVKSQPSWMHTFWQPVIFLRLLLARTDLYHIPNTSPLFFKTCPTVISILDLQEFYTDKYGRYRGAYRKLINYIAARVADRVITISEHSKRDIVKLLKVPEEKVVVTYLGVDKEFTLLDRLECYARVDAGYALGGSEYIVSVGELHPGKNFVRLIKAFAKVRERGAGLKLLIVGKKGWNYDEIFSTVEELKLCEDVIFTGYVCAEELPVLYNGAVMSVFPTLYEGFGLPALESMACGTPLVASNTSSLPEVVGEAGVLVDPYDVDMIAEAICKVSSDSGLHADLVRKGLEQVKKFSWSKTAAETWKVYEEVYDMSRKGRRR